MPKGNHRKARSNKGYVTGHADAQLERARTNPAFDLKSWAWFALGWYSQTLRVWTAFASSFPHDAKGSSIFRSIPASVYYIRHALAVIGNDVPPRVCNHIAEHCLILERHNSEFARCHDGLEPGDSFETETTAVAGLQAVVNDLDTTDSENSQWLTFGLRLGAWYSFEQFHDRSLAESTEDIVELCREMPRSTINTAPSIADIAKLAAKTEVAAEERAREICRYFDASETPVEKLPDSLITVRLLRAVFNFGGRVHSSLLLKRLTPRWEKELNRGTLSFRGRPVRMIANVEKSKNIVRVLNCFEEEGWPASIDSPFTGDSLFLHTTLNQLREGLSRSITFRAANVGKGIQWVNLEEATLSRLNHFINNMQVPDGSVLALNSWEHRVIILRRSLSLRRLPAAFFVPSG